MGGELRKANPKCVMKDMWLNTARLRQPSPTQAGKYKPWEKVELPLLMCCDIGCLFKSVVLQKHHKSILGLSTMSL